MRYRLYQSRWWLPQSGLPPAPHWIALSQSRVAPALVFLCIPLVSAYIRPHACTQVQQLAQLPSLVELDVRGNPIAALHGSDELLVSLLPPSLLLLNGRPVGPRAGPGPPAGVAGVVDTAAAAAAWGRAAGHRVQPATSTSHRQGVEHGAGGSGVQLEAATGSSCHDDDVAAMEEAVRGLQTERGSLRGERAALQTALTEAEVRSGECSGCHVIAIVPAAVARVKLCTVQC